LTFCSWIFEVERYKKSRLKRQLFYNHLLKEFIFSSL
jgi:hypothetical protein